MKGVGGGLHFLWPQEPSDCLLSGGLLTQLGVLSAAQRAWVVYGSWSTQREAGIRNEIFYFLKKVAGKITLLSILNYL